jgi:hypothetical protein
MEEKWQRCRTVMATAAEQVLRIEKKKKSNDWYDEYERLVKERDVARIKMLQRRTRTTVREYADKRRLANRECRKKKRMFEETNLENIEELAQKKEISGEFTIDRGLRQGDVLLTQLFNITWKR